jgi:hypothetical protein
MAAKEKNVLIKAERAVSPDDTLSPAEAKMVRRGEAQSAQTWGIETLARRKARALALRFPTTRFPRAERWKFRPSSPRVKPLRDRRGSVTHESTERRTLTVAARKHASRMAGHARPLQAIHVPDM